MTGCSFDGCTREAEKRGWCRTHYVQWRRTGEVWKIGTNPHRGRKRCDFESCDRFVHAYGYCGTHNRQKSLGIELRAIRSARPDAAEGFNWCSTCKQFQPIELFSADNSRPSQYKRVCHDCHAAKMRAWNKSNTLPRRWYKIEQKYGITKEQYQELWALQSGKCAVCRTDMSDLLSDVTDARQKSAIDHDHATGAVRGLLCGPCNCAIGYMQDDPKRLEAAAKYLREPMRRIS